VLPVLGNHRELSFPRDDEVLGDEYLNLSRDVATDDSEVDLHAAPMDDELVIGDVDLGRIENGFLQDGSTEVEVGLLDHHFSSKGEAPTLLISIYQIS
jgi:hypothetical protein